MIIDCTPMCFQGHVGRNTSGQNTLHGQVLPFDMLCCSNDKRATPEMLNANTALVFFTISSDKKPGKIEYKN